MHAKAVSPAPKASSPAHPRASAPARRQPTAVASSGGLHSFSEVAVDAPFVQRKPVLGAAEDPLEREADRVADQVMRMPASGLQGVPGQEMPAGDPRGPARKATASPGERLDAETLGFAKPRFGYVSVLNDARASGPTNIPHALSYTSARHVVVNPSQHASAMPAGRRLLSEEALQSSASPADGSDITAARRYGPRNGAQIGERGPAHGPDSHSPVAVPSWVLFSRENQETGPILSGQEGAPADRELLPVYEASGPSFDFGKISIFSARRRPSSASHRLQPKLAIGAVNDPLEQEADRIADRIMRVPDSDLSIAPAPLTLSRKCAACEDDEKNLQRKPKLGDVDEIQRPPDSELTKGGERLPAQAAKFFEARFGRDFSAVRLHTGETAVRYNDAVNAYAFTYGSHIWLGPGLSPRPSHILAHELAHVVQQTQPPPIASAPVQPGLSASYHAVQRYAPYWLPAEFVVKDKEARGKVGTGTHQYVLPAIGKENEIFTEAPVPNADRKSADDGKVGIADLFDSTNASGEPTTVGVYFVGNSPKRLRSNREFKYKGERHEHKDYSRPQIDETGHGVRLAVGAPTKIFVGDLKPPHDTPDAAEGPEQVQNYLKGFGWAREKVNGLIYRQGEYEVKGRPESSLWPQLETGIINLKIPSQFEEPAASGQPLKPLVLNY